MNTNVETYTPGHSANAVAFMSRRRALTHAAFFTPLLRPGMRLLDCGCGPGTITLDLARVVYPGEVVGIDSASDQMVRSQDIAHEHHLPLRFQVGTVYELPFPEASFDAAFAHGLLEHLREPVAALREVRRVVRPGGFFGARSPDWGGFLLHPYPDEIAAAIARYEELMRANGGDPHGGRALPAWLKEAGFSRILRSATYEIYEDPRFIAEYIATQLDPVAEKSAAAVRRWSADPDAMFAQAWVEAIGYV
jgi:SAM-dependent methyltransferase